MATTVRKAPVAEMWHQLSVGVDDSRSIQRILTTDCMPSSLVRGRSKDAPLRALGIVAAEYRPGGGG